MVNAIVYGYARDVQCVCPCGLDPDARGVCGPNDLPLEVGHWLVGTFAGAAAWAQLQKAGGNQPSFTPTPFPLPLILVASGSQNPRVQQ